MSQSTPLNMLRRSEQPQQSSSMGMDMGMDMDFSDMKPNTGSNSSSNNMSSETQLVEDILKEMGTSSSMEQQSTINSQALHYAMDNSQVPPTKYMSPQHPENIANYDNYSQKLYNDNTNSQNSGFLGQMGINLNGDSLRDRIMKNIKYPGLVLVISFLISLPEFNRFLFGFFPRLLLESGQVSIGGVLLKSLIGMILFSIIALFI